VRVLAIDLGRRRIGLAVSDASGTLARPLETLDARGRSPLALVLDVIHRLEQEDDGLAAIVVGLPKRLDGSANDQTPLAIDFSEQLRARASQRIVLQDERLSSIEAESRLALRDKDWRSRKEKLDAAAAAVILQDYLDALPRDPGPETGPETE
jgi:putative holliday junction resolvase